jgi:excisionase family DNA binding protein
MGTKRPSKPEIGHELLTISEAAIFCRHGKRTIQRWLREGKLPYHRIAGGRRVLIARTDLDALIKLGRIEPAALSPPSR